jgi:glycosyltransferase involved in cell wall biosynthesis
MFHLVKRKPIIAPGKNPERLKGYGYSLTKERVSSMGIKKIAFIQKGLIPLASGKVAQALKERFPDFEVEIIDVSLLLRRRKRVILMNLFSIFNEYGLDILLGRKKIRDCFFRTTYIFKVIKKLMVDHLAKENYAFTFQMQSLYDASIEGTPHFVYTDHTNLANLHYGELQKNRLYSQGWINLEKMIYQNATLIFTRSNHITQSLLDQYGCPPDRVVCVYAGSNAETRRTEEMDNQDYSNKNILFVGMDWERKGGPVLVEAFQKVLKIHPEASLTIVGCTPRIELPNCKVVGRVSLQEVGDYYRQASVFCLPTTLEPFGIVFVEALSYRLPIVATRVGAIPDFVINGVNGYLVEPAQAEPLAECLIDLIGNPHKCRTFGERGQGMATERYTWAKVGDRMKENIAATLCLDERVGQPAKERMRDGI